MDLMLLSESEIKITLSKEDLDKFDLTCETIDYDSTKTRKVIWEIFDKAKVATGFDAASERIYVQLYPLKNGGCELYVSKLKSCDGDKRHRRREVFKVAGSQKYIGSSENTVFSFDNFDDLYSACKALKETGYCAQSSLYCTDDIYYLIIEEFVFPLRELCASDVIKEFGSHVPQKYITARLNEYAKKICDISAVEQILAV